MPSGSCPVGSNRETNSRQRTSLELLKNSVEKLCWLTPAPIAVKQYIFPEGLSSLAARGAGLALSGSILLSVGSYGILEMLLGCGAWHIAPGKKCRAYRSSVKDGSPICRFFLQGLRIVEFSLLRSWPRQWQAQNRSQKGGNWSAELLQGVLKSQTGP